VIATLAIVRVRARRCKAQIRALGANALTVLPGTMTSGGARSGAGSITDADPEDAQAIRAECPAVSGGRTNRAHVRPDRLRANNWSTQIQGTTADYTIIRQWP